MVPAERWFWETPKHDPQASKRWTFFLPKETLGKSSNNIKERYEMAIADCENAEVHWRYHEQFHRPINLMTFILYVYQFVFRSKGDSGEELQEQRKRRDGDHWLRKRSGRAGISWWVYCTSFVSRNMRKLESFLVPHSTICGYLSWWVLYYTSFPSKGESALSVKSSKRNGDHWLRKHWGRTVILKKSFTNRWTWWILHYTSLCLENIRKL